MLNKTIKRAIQKRIKKHHKLYDLPVIAEYWEEVFAKSVEDGEGYSDWKPDKSHCIGKDQVCTIDGETYRISNKSGKYNRKNETLVISGSRSGEYETLEDKIKFFSDKKEDVYVCCATETKKPSSKNYYIFFFESKLLNYSEANWLPKYGKNQTQTGWYCDTDNYRAEIRHSLSGQIWTTIKLLNANITPEVISID
jgi:hypothetical protein